MPAPIAKEGDRLDFTFEDKSLIGTITAVHDNTPFTHAYSIRSNGQDYKVFEDKISTPYGEHDDPIYGSRIMIAVQTANEWTKRAEPIIREFLELDQMHARLQSKLFEARNPKNGKYCSVGMLEEATRLVEKQVETFGAIIDATREEFISDEYFHTDTGASAETEDRNIADNEAVEKTVISVEAAINAVAEQIRKGA